MPPTPSRLLREQEQEQAARDAGRQANEAKYTEFKLGCDSGAAHACTSLGEWWGAMRGDYAKAAELYTDACLDKRHPQACLNLGLILATGRPGVPSSQAQALEVLSVGCRAGNADACSEAGRMALRLGGRAAAAATAAATASAPAAPGAADAALAAAVARADALFEAGCSVAEGTASNARCCGMRAELHLSPRLALHLPPSAAAAAAQPGELQRWLELGCAGEHGDSCMKLAAAYRGASSGSALGAALRLAPDPRKAFALEVKGLEWMGMTPTAAAKAVEKKHGRPPAA